MSIPGSGERGCYGRCTFDLLVFVVYVVTDDGAARCRCRPSTAAPAARPLCSRHLGIRSARGFPLLASFNREVEEQLLFVCFYR